MPFFESSQEWLRQSSLLLEARPTTTRITTKYAITQADKRRKAKTTEGGAPEAAAADGATDKPPRGSLVLKTFDPVSGVTLKYRTTKAAEVSRLIHSLGKLGSRMAGLPEDESKDELMADASEAAPAAADKPETKAAAPAPQQQQQQQPPPAAGGGKGKKKKGKK